MLQITKPDLTTRTADELEADVNHVQGALSGAYLMASSDPANMTPPILANCAELTEMGYVEIASAFENPIVESVIVKPAPTASTDQRKPDHAFLLIGRDKTTDASDFESWNDDVIVLDIHSREIYPKSLLQEKMNLISVFTMGSTNLEVQLRVEENTNYTLPTRLDTIPQTVDDVKNILTASGYIRDLNAAANTLAAP